MTYVTDVLAVNMVMDKLNLRQSNLVYPIEEENFGIVNHLSRKRLNPWILIRKRSFLIFLVKSPYFRFSILNFGNRTDFPTQLHRAFPERQ